MRRRRYPSHDPLSDLRSYARFLRGPGWPRLRRKRDRDLDDGGVPVEPDKPRNLEGGAAAALEFDD
jgi:hypothetical protein